MRRRADVVGLCLKEVAMAQAKNKTVPTDHSVEAFLNAVEDEQKRKDSLVLLELMKEITGMEPQMWGSSIVGFGVSHYKYESGREGDMPMVGFSPRKQNLTVYCKGNLEADEAQRQKLGKHTLSVACLYIKRLSDVDMPTLKQVIIDTFEGAQKLAKGQ
jgi:hypothetical protein